MTASFNPMRTDNRAVRRARRDTLRRRVMDCGQVIWIASVLGAVTWSQAAALPGRYCGDLVESGRSSGATQEEALKAAQVWWSSRAGVLGPGYENWDSAGERAMECEKEGAGLFKCKATGRPCLPAGARPKVEM